MSRDLFVDTVATRPAQRRSKWTILGSLLAHVGIVAALVIVPIVSALDNVVLHANDALTYSMPAVAILPSPPPPTRDAPSIAPDLKLNAAPSTSAQQPVTRQPDFHISGGGTGVPAGLTRLTGLIDLGVPPGPAPPPAPPVPQVPIRPGGVVNPPERIAYAAPAYPTIAKNAHIEGTVILEATIDEFGTVRDVRVLRSIPLLDRAAIDAVSKWRYTPTRLNGVAVPIRLTVTVSFALHFGCSSFLRVPDS